MTKNLLTLLIISVGLISCQTEEKKSESKDLEVIETVDNTEKTEEIFAQFKSLYNELLEFKNTKDFEKYGFAEGGPYNSWLNEVEQMENDPNSKLLIQKGVVIGELKALGLEYVSSKGQETEITKSFNKYFSDAINGIPQENIETSSGNSNYELIKKEYNLLGKWEISNSNMNSSYPYEIYEKGSEYIGVIPEDDYRTEILEKKGNDYYIKGNKYGEFYKLDGNKNMTLYDKDGELASMGYKATKK